MTGERRPTPETFLKRIQEEERHEKSGKLKIYLGAAPGVGKTHTMLTDALAKRAQGLDVVAGVVETHKRQEIENLLQQFEQLPKLEVEYRGHQLTEFDLDATLKRNPGVILIDEMAHTNAPGLRHNKRWQDIKEILDRGIDVYTTINVQHIESLNDVVAQIIHSHVKETVPDFMIEMADTIELVDLAPEDLLKRLSEGKVYYPKHAEIAAENFFRKGNLIALRELALRTTAETVGTQVLLYRQGQGIKHVWPTKGKILVCVGWRADSSKLIRVARRLAKSLKAEWIALYVDTPRLNLSDEQRNIAIQNLRFAEQLGAETRILTGFDVVKEIMNFAHEQNVTTILVWKHIRSRLHDMIFGSLADEIIRLSGEIDVYIVTGEIPGIKPAKIAVAKKSIPWREYGIALGVLGVATLINLFLFPYLTRPASLLLVYLLGVTIVALYGRVGPSLFVSFASVLLYHYFFVSPSYLLSNADFNIIFTFVVMVVISQIISYLIILIRRQAERSSLVEKHTSVLHTLSKQLASTRGVDKLSEAAMKYMSDIFESEVIVLLRENNYLVIKGGVKLGNDLSEKEMSVAQWVYEMGQNAGLGTDTLPFSEALYIPLLTSQRCIGVLRVCPVQKDRLFSPDEMHLLEDCANQLALALGVDRLQEERKESELRTETDRVKSTLLQSVSHDLRTPLVSIVGAASTLMELGSELEGKAIKKIGKYIYLESEQLSRLINNLLQITYLEAETIALQKEPHVLMDLITQVVKASGNKIGKKPVNVTIPKDLPLIPFDATLMQEVFVNLLDNALKFTPADSPIDISAKMEGDRVIVSIEDRGPGIMPDEVKKLFEKFYRGRMLTTERGLGLGLAICRSIVRAHGGDIWAENIEGGGAAFRFTLPLA